MTEDAVVIPMKDFDEDIAQQESRPVTFKLAGKTFRTKGFLSPAAMLSPEVGLTYAVHMLRTVLVPEDREAFDALLADPDAPFNSNILDDIAVWVMGEISGRPTAPDATSGNGRPEASTG